MKKLYYDSAYIRTFEAKVLSCAEGKKGYEVVLDQTAFFPEGGGQPYDTGCTRWRSCNGSPRKEWRDHPLYGRTAYRR